MSVIYCGSVNKSEFCTNKTYLLHKWTRNRKSPLNLLNSHHCDFILSKNSISNGFSINTFPILFPPVMPVIVPFPLNEKPAHMDQFLSMTCAVSDGDLPLNIFWTFNNQPITSDIDVSISKLGKRTSVLTIDSVNGHHMGQYTCHGRNEAGSTSYSTELKVIGVF